ncbi:hypothetical protein [Pandoraea pneumonica]|nr:hypothetical protein [Pandoraea pneumonica]
MDRRYGGFALAHRGEMMRGARRCASA